MKMLVQSVNREKFVAERYRNFLEKKEALSILLRGNLVMLTDLDQVCEDIGGKKLKDVVICDSCNQDITEPSFIMLEGQKVYHYACCKQRPDLPGNVVAFKPRSEE